MNDDQDQAQSESPIAASVQRLRGELDKWMDAAKTQGGKALNVLGLSGDRPWRPAVDVIETPESVRVLVNLPGVDPAAVDVTIAGNMLTIRGSAADPMVTDNDVQHVRQRNTGAFERSIPMPVPVNADEVIAEARHGVLTIRLGKSERAKARQIAIRSGE